MSRISRKSQKWTQEMLDLPQDLLFDLPRLTLIGNKERISKIIAESGIFRGTTCVVFNAGFFGDFGDRTCDSGYSKP